MIIETSVEYDFIMTYVLGMVCSDGILLASDGLATQYDFTSGKWLEPLTNAKKLVKISDTCAAAFAGSVGSLEATENYISAFQAVARPLKVHEVAQVLGQSTARHFDAIIKRHNRGMQIIVGGLDDNKPSLLLYERYVVDDDSEALYPVLTGAVDAGFNKATESLLQTRYKKSPKNYKALRGLAIEMLKLATENSEEVGGEYYIWHIKKNGITTETIKNV